MLARAEQTARVSVSGTSDGAAAVVSRDPGERDGGGGGLGDREARLVGWN